LTRYDKKQDSFVQWLSADSVTSPLKAGSASAADMRVMISAGFYGVYSELGPAFERASGHRLITTRGPSMGDSPEAIPTRLARGELADVVIINGGIADELGNKGLLRADSAVPLARSLIGMVVRKGAVKPDIGSVEALRQQSLSRIPTAAAASIYRLRCSSSLALQIRLRAKAKRCEDLHPASRWLRSSHEARRRSAFNKSPN